MSELLFYNKPVVLNRELHKALRFAPLTEYGFTRGINSVPITGFEFFEASRDMTVLFTRTEEGRYFPITMMSLQNSAHELVDEKGQWTGSYIPAFIRRYPFALNRDNQVCLDEESGVFSTEGDEGEALFTSEGENAEVLKRIIGFLRQFEREMQRTRDFCQALAEKDLLAPFDVQVRGAEGRGVNLRGFHAINARKFAELRGDTLELWFGKGWIAWVYAHLHSIGALGKLSRGEAGEGGGAEAADEAPEEVAEESA